ncbi:MAG: hypothetical protein OXJ64_06380 [Boseongicola sp.]|nr:hypothetical protein [Boseongicola sp.]
MERFRELWIAAFDVIVAGLGWWHLAWVVPAVLLTVFFGRRFRQRIEALEERHPITIQNVLGGSQPSPVEATSKLTTTGTKEDRLQELATVIEPFTEPSRHDYKDIWPVHIALGELGVAWPGPGIDPQFRRDVSDLLLDACRKGDLEAARSAWTKASTHVS